MASTSGDPSAAEALRGGRILSSRLYLDGVPSSKAPVVYSPAYDIEFNGIEKQHPFDSAKWGRVRNFLVDAGLLQSDRIVEPLEASEDDLLVVHSESYLSSLKSSAKVARIVEVPAVALLPNLLVQQKLLYPFRKQVGGSILSAKLALERGCAINIAGGFHHCSAEEGGGFCAYADISLCIHFAFVHLNISRVMIIDLDAHQGNDHEKDFGSDGRVYTLDMYNSGIYPFDHVAKKYIDQKVELNSGTKTEDYLEILDKALKESSTLPQYLCHFTYSISDHFTYSISVISLEPKYECECRALTKKCWGELRICTSNQYGPLFQHRQSLRTFRISGNMKFWQVFIGKKFRQVILS